MSIVLWFLDALKWLVPLGAVMVFGGIFIAYVRDRWPAEPEPKHEPDLGPSQWMLDQFERDKAAALHSRLYPRPVTKIELERLV